MDTLYNATFAYPPKCEGDVREECIRIAGGLTEMSSSGYWRDGFGQVIGERMLIGIVTIPGSKLDTLQTRITRILKDAGEAAVWFTWHRGGGGIR